MFFDEDVNKHDISKNKENFGFFTPNNTDYNMSLYEAIYERIYSRWKYHYILVFCLLFILSCNYPIFFAILFFDIIIQWSMLRYGIDNFIAQDVEYNMEQHDSEVEGGDIRIDPFVFLSYDSLGYIIYGISNIGELVCSEVYDYNNYFGLQNKVLSYSSDILLDDILLDDVLLDDVLLDDVLLDNNYLDNNYLDNNYLDYDILNFKNRGNINLSNIVINKLDNTITNINVKKYDFNYYIFSNYDLSYSYFDLNKKK